PAADTLAGGLLHGPAGDVLHPGVDLGALALAGFVVEQDPGPGGEHDAPDAVWMFLGGPQADPAAEALPDDVGPLRTDAVHEPQQVLGEDRGVVRDVVGLGGVAVPQAVDGVHPQAALRQRHDVADESFDVTGQPAHHDDVVALVTGLQGAGTPLAGVAVANLRTQRVGPECHDSSSCRNWSTAGFTTAGFS